MLWHCHKSLKFYNFIFIARKTKEGIDEIEHVGDDKLMETATSNSNNVLSTASDIFPKSNDLPSSAVVYFENQTVKNGQKGAWQSSVKDGYVDFLLFLFCI